MWKIVGANHERNAFHKNADVAPMPYHWLIRYINTSWIYKRFLSNNGESEKEKKGGGEGSLRLLISFSIERLRDDDGFVFIPLICLSNVN